MNDKNDKDKIKFAKLDESLEKLKASMIKFPEYTYALPRIEPFEFPPTEIPTEKEKHEYESSRVFIKRLSQRIRLWRKKIPEDAQPVILAILSNGTQIKIHGLYEEGHNGIAIAGKIDNTDCLLLTHQNNLQILCYIYRVEEEKDKFKIGFRVDGKEFEE
ncbi:MAG: hypothetical protein IIA61_13325 [Candidatus Marinimicrobia bacterium]|nr:hypothetical protein [Candidatus Neomarinimicrobiota bacterium]